jgi:hypothetical protein
MTSARWQFVWDPAGSGGPITFHAAVAVGFSTSFLQHVCLRDATQDAAAGSSDMADMAGMDHGRRRLLGGGGRGVGVVGSRGSGGGGGVPARRRARARDTDAAAHAPEGTVFSACPASGHGMSSGSGGMGESVFSAAAVSSPAAATPVLFQGAGLTSRGRFAGALLATFAFAAASSAAGAWAAEREAAAFGTPGADEAADAGALARSAGRRECAANAGAAAASLGEAPLAPLAQPPRFARAAGAAALVLRTGGHYGCMLISMTFNVWLLLALMSGHAAAYLAAALAARRRARAAEAAHADALARSVCG